jgi:chaperonin GroES
MKILHDNVFVKCIDKDDVAKGGIVLPYDILKKWNEFQMGFVKAVGPGIIARNGKRIKTTVKVGDKVYYPRDNFRQRTEYKGDTVEIMREEVIIYVEREDNGK